MDINLDITGAHYNCVLSQEELRILPRLLVIFRVALQCLGQFSLYHLCVAS